jgi:hypothetical protein
MGLIGGNTNNNTNGNGTAKLEVNPQRADLRMGQDTNLSVICQDSSGKTQSVQLLMQDPTFATATTFGTLIMLHPLSVGSTNLLIAGVGMTLIVPVTVASSSSSTGDLTVSTTSVSLLPGDNKQVTITSSSGFTAITSNAAIATVVPGSGLISIYAGQSSGSANITVTSGSGSSASISVTVSNTITPASLTLGSSSISFNAGETRTVAVTAVAQGGAQDGYSVTQSDIVQSTPKGPSLELYGMKAGNVQLVITTNSGKTASLTVTVNAVANQIDPPMMQAPYVDPATGMVSLFWNPVANAQGYDIERAKKSDLLYTPLGSVASAIYSYSDTPPTRDLDYVYRVRGKAGTNNGTWAFQQVYVPAAGSNMLSAPTFSTMTPPWSTATSVNFSWNMVPSAISYEIERTNPDGIAVTPLFTTINTSYTDSANLLSGKPYSYRVRAINAAKQPGRWSDPCTVTTQATNASVLSPPTGLVANPEWIASTLRVSLSWNYVTGASGWVIQRQENFTWVEKAKLPTVEPRSWTDYMVQPNTVYSYRVAAVDAANVTGNFAPIQTNNTGTDPASTPPKAPSITSSHNATNPTSAFVSWADDTTGSPSMSYDVLLAGTYGDCNNATSATALQSRTAMAGTSTEFTGLVGGRSYFVKVRGNNSFGPGGWTVPFEIITPATAQLPGSPTNLSVSDGFSYAQNSIFAELSWSVASFASTYRVERAMVTAGMTMAWSTLTPASGIQVTSFKDFGIYPNMSYKYRVTGENILGSGTPSVELDYTAPQTTGVSVKFN